jgi:hypothetical protein
VKFAQGLCAGVVAILWHWTRNLPRGSSVSEDSRHTASAKDVKTLSSRWVIRKESVCPIDIVDGKRLPVRGKRGDRVNGLTLLSR